MRLLLDQDVYAITARFLIDAGHDVVLVAELGLSKASDEDILRRAQKENYILVTRDRDYGNLVFVRTIGTGVIYLKPASTTNLGISDTGLHWWRDQMGPDPKCPPDLADARHLCAA